MKVLRFIFIVFIMPSMASTSTWRLKNDFNATAFDSMPPLYHMDDFDSCASTIHPIPFPRQFCILSVKISALYNSDLMKVVKNYDQKLNFNHEYLKFGICASSCLRMHTKIGNLYEKYLTEKTDLKEIEREIGKLVMMHKLSNVCVNKILMDFYGLKGDTKLEYCVHAEFPYYRLDAFFMLSIYVIFMLFTIGAFYEKFKDRSRVKNFLAKWQITRKFLQTYSIKNNWRRLIENGKDDENLTVLYAFKVFLLFGFIYQRVYQEIASIPFANPVNIERNISTLKFHLFTFETATNVFLTISGMILSLTLLPLIKSTQLPFYRFIFKVFNQRQDQIFPLTIFFFFFYSSVFQHFSSAPLWRLSTVAEAERCKKNWKFNLVSTQNYFGGEKCMEPTWILAAELHLIIIGSFVLILAVKFEKFAKWILGGFLGLSFGVKMWRIFKGNLGAIAIVTPELLRAGHQSIGPKFNELYYTTHMNAGNFIVGLIFGFLLIERQEILKKFTKNWIFYSSILNLIFILPIFRLYFQLNSSPSPLISAIIGTVLKHSDGFQFCVIFLNLTQKLKNLNNSFVKILEKLFVAAFFSHIAITKIFIGSTKVLLELSAVNVFSYSIAIFIVTYVVAVVIHLAIQAPTVYWMNDEEEKKEK